MDSRDDEQTDKDEYNRVVEGYIRAVEKEVIVLAGILGRQMANEELAAEQQSDSADSGKDYDK